MGCAKSAYLPSPLPIDLGFAIQSGLKGSLLSTFCGSMTYTAPKTLLNRKYSGEQADLWSLCVPPRPQHPRTREEDTS